MTRIRITWPNGEVTHGDPTDAAQFARSCAWAEVRETKYIRSSSGALMAVTSTSGMPRPERYPAPGPWTIRGAVYELVECAE